MHEGGLSAAHRRFTSQASVMQEPGLKSWAFRRLHAQLTAPWEAHSVLFEAIAASSTGKPPAPLCGLEVCQLAVAMPEKGPSLASDKAVMRH